MNAFVFISLIASLACLGLGVWVFYLNRKPILNKLFFLVILTGFIYSFTTVMMWNSSTSGEAYIWHKVGTMWPFFVTTVLNFALVFTNNKWIKNKIHYLVLYIPATALWLLDLLTNYINTPPIMEYWGYNDQASSTWIYGISTFWSALLPLLSFGMCLAYYLRTIDPAQRKRARNVTVGFAIPIVAFIITNVLGRMVDMGLPNLGPISTVFFAAFVGYAIVRYDLFTLDAALAAENIVTTIPDSLILTNLETEIIKVNDHLIELTGFSEKQMVKKPLSKLFAGDEKELTRILEEIAQKGLVRDKELVLKTENCENRTVLFSGSVVKPRPEQSIGLTCIIHDITEHKNMEQRLLKSERLASIGELAGQLGHDLRNR